MTTSYATETASIISAPTAPEIEGIQLEPADRGHIKWSTDVYRDLPDSVMPYIPKTFHEQAADPRRSHFWLPGSAITKKFYLIPIIDPVLVKDEESGEVTDVYVKFGLSGWMNSKGRMDPRERDEALRAQRVDSHQLRGFKSQHYSAKQLMQLGAEIGQPALTQRDYDLLVEYAGTWAYMLENSVTVNKSGRPMGAYCTEALVPNTNIKFSKYRRYLSPINNDGTGATLYFGITTNPDPSADGELVPALAAVMFEGFKVGGSGTGGINAAQPGKVVNYAKGEVEGVVRHVDYTRRLVRSSNATSGAPVADMDPEF